MITKILIAGVVISNLAAAGLIINRVYRNYLYNGMSQKEWESQNKRKK